MNKSHIRQVERRDLDDCYKIEKKCFPTKEAATKKRIKKRIKTFPEGFLVAEIKDKVVGMINSTSTNKNNLSLDRLKDMTNFERNGENIVVFSLAVDPDFQGRGLSKVLMKAFISKCRELKKKKILLLCKENMIKYYKKYGFKYLGESQSNHGNSKWHEMSLDI